MPAPDLGVERFAVTGAPEVGLRLLTVFESPSQVREVDGAEAAKTFFENHQVHIIYMPANIDVATDISRELGTFNYRARSMSGPLFFSKGNRSQSESDQSRALLLPQEVKALGDDEVLLLAKGCAPIRAEKIRWYLDRNLKGRVVPPPTVPLAPPAQAAPVDEPADTRAIEPADVDGLYARPLSDFSLDFSDVEIPASELSEAEAEALADQVYASLTR